MLSRLCCHCNSKRHWSWRTSISEKIIRIPSHVSYARKSGSPSLTSNDKPDDRERKIEKLLQTIHKRHQLKTNPLSVPQNGATFVSVPVNQPLNQPFNHMITPPTYFTVIPSTQEQLYPENMKTPSFSFFVPRNPKQEEYARLLNARHPDILVAIGPAGTSKTMGATLVGLEKLMKKEVSRLVLTRPAVSADEELGFLKGDLQDKMKPWLLPIYDTLRLYMTPDEIDTLMASQKIEICSLAHMRGRTFHDCFVIVDEAQNTTPSQMLMLLTRIGRNTKLVVTGDTHQHDRTPRYHNYANEKYENGVRRHTQPRTSGLVDFIQRFNQFSDFEGYEGYEDKMLTLDQMVRIFEFGPQHIERHPAIPLILDVYAF